MSQWSSSSRFSFLPTRVPKSRKERCDRSMKNEPGFDLERRIEAVERIQLLASLDKLEAIKIEQGINQTLEEKLLSLEKELDVRNRHILLYNQVTNELKTKLSESELREAKLRENHAKAEWDLKELRVRVSDLEAEKRASGLIIETLRREKSEADGMVLKADEMLKESKRKSSENLLGLEKEIRLLKRRGCMDNQNLNELKTERLKSTIREENLRKSHAEAERRLEELRVHVSDLESGKRAACSIIEELRREKSQVAVMVLKADEKLQESNRRSSEKLLGFEKEIELLKRRGWLDNQNLNELKTERSESVIREANLRKSHAEAERCLQELRVRVSDLEGQKRTADLIIKELRREKSQADVMLLKADVIVKESRQRSLKAREAAEVNITRFKNVVPIAEKLFKLLEMNVEDLVGMKDMLVGEEDETNEHGMTVDDCDEEFVTSQYRGQKRKRSGVISACKFSPVVRKRVFGADMVRAFQEDNELCVEAVCALYRQHELDSESSEASNRRFYHFQKLWQHELAEYLIQGDPELRVTRAAAEVKQQFPHVLNMCRQLAIEYSSYFIAMPRTPSSGQDEQHAFSLSLVCRRCYMLTDTHAMGACETGCAGEGEDTSLDILIETPDH